MKFMFALLGLVLFSTGLSAQVNVRGIVRDRVNSRAAQKVGEATDAVLDQAEEDVRNGSKKSDDASEAEGEESEESSDQSKKASKTPAASTKNQPADLKMYAKYDFVAGDQVIFEDNLKEETVGEFPSRFTATEGQVQVSDFKGEKILQSFTCSDLIPQMSVDNYLPEQFTIEFDMYFTDWGGKGGDWTWVNILFYDKSDPDGIVGAPEALRVDIPNMTYKSFTSKVPEELLRHNDWNHVAIAINKNMLKGYINQGRALNAPAFQGKAKAISLELVNNGCGEASNFIKNVRIAAGGIDLYKRITTEGKFITHGITFDVNKSVIRPESMGVINQLAKVLQEQASLKFEIGGHTDGDGDAAANLKLSQARAEAVKAQLVSMGIDASRLTTKGYGETKPTGPNTTPEGKANNRRVEFVKL